MDALCLYIGDPLGEATVEDQGPLEQLTIQQYSVQGLLVLCQVLAPSLDLVKDRVGFVQALENVRAVLQLPQQLPLASDEHACREVVAVSSEEETLCGELGWSPLVSW